MLAWAAVSWTPVLRDDLARAARVAIAAIAAEIDRVPPGRKQPIDVALFWPYAAAILDDEASAAASEAACAALIAYVDAGPRRFALHDGLAGAGWVLTHITDGSVAGLAALDDLLADRLDRVAHDFDVIGGLAGDAIYFLERHAAGAPRAAMALARVVDQLRGLATLGPEGTSWFRPASRLTAGIAELSPNGHYDCGVAHGVPGVVGALARVAATEGLDDATRSAARTLATGGLAWMRARLLPPHPRGRFAHWLQLPGEPSPGPANSAWCYGEPGAAVALWAAARRLGEPVEPWRELARDSARRSLNDSDVRTPGLCHGAAGLAHLFGRCYQATWEPVFAESANRWIERALAMRVPGSGPGGFTLSGTGAPLEPSQELLLGVTGIGLAFCAAIGDAEPAWDRLLACDLPAD
jgi:lantibiotic biosynthesis protein